MNTLLVLFLICAFQYTKCDEELGSKGFIKAIPKNNHTPLQKNIKIINARKFNKLRKPESQAYNHKKENKKEAYKAFPPIHKGIDTAEKLFFQGIHVVDRKPRVKKVLPAYGLNVFRNKRSADIIINQNISNVGAFNHRRNIKNQNKASKTHKPPTKNVDRKKDKKITKEIAKLTKGEVNYSYRKYKTKSTKTHLRREKKSTPRLKYTENVRNKIKSQMNKKSSTQTRNRHKRQRIVKNHDKRKVKSRRLIASRDASVKEYPYVVSIQKSGEHWCAGALLNQRLVITTANCIWKSYRVSKLSIRAGTRHIDRGGQVAKIMEVMKHPFWNIRSGPDNDLGLLLLDRNIKKVFCRNYLLTYSPKSCCCNYKNNRLFSDTCHEVDLPNRAMWPAFDDVWVTSWGSNRRDGVYDSLASTLQVYHAMLLDHDKCNNMTMRFGVPVSHNFICVTQTGRRAPCTRDTGAPAVSDGVLWGVASWGIRKFLYIFHGWAHTFFQINERIWSSAHHAASYLRIVGECGTERFPAMFSYVASKTNLDFITNATHQLMSDKRFYPYPDRFEIRSGVTKPTTT